MNQRQPPDIPVEVSAADLPESFTLRPVRIEDAEKLIVPFWRNDEIHLGEPDITLEDFIADLQRPDYSVELDARAIFAPNSECAGFVDVWAEAPYVNNFLFASTHPNYCDLGLGTWMTRWGVNRLRERISDAAPDLQFNVVCFGKSKDSRALDLLANEGFVFQRIYYDMAIDFDGRPAVTRLPEGIALRAFDPEKDVDRLFDAYDATFRDHFGYVQRTREVAFARWHHMVLEHTTYDPSLITLAEAGDEVVGFCVGWPDESRPGSNGYIHHLGTLRSWRRRGLARALLTRGFLQFYERGAKRVTLGVDAASPTGALDLYEKAGMYIKASTTSMRLVLREGAMPSVAQLP